MYSLKISPRETNMTKVLAAVQKHAGYSISSEKLEKKEVKDVIKADEDTAGRMMVSGTPTIYIDGIWDQSRTKYKELIK